MPWTKMLDSIVCVVACALRGRAKKLEKDPHARYSLITASEQVTV